jgi:hypothetical protein
MNQNQNIDNTAGTVAPAATRSASNWRVEYRKKHPLPKFTHDHGCWFADMVPIMRTTSVGKSFPMHRESPLDEVPEYVVGAYCGINRLCYGNFMTAHSPKYGGGDSSQNAGTQRGRDAGATNATETRTRPSLK